MTTNTYRSQNIEPFFSHLRLNRGLAFGVIIITALLAFEIFNYSTTDYALTDLLGDLKFMGLRWATILSIAFCGIDFAGIARLFTPEPGKTGHNETWYLFGAWLLAATMNAMLTWWGVSLAILNHQTLGSAVLERETLLRIVPIFVAVLVWLIRVLIIGTFSVAGDHLFELAEENTAIQGRPTPRPSPPRNTSRASGGTRASRRTPAPRSASAAMASHRSVPRQDNASDPEYVQAELTYHPVSMRTKGRATEPRPDTTDQLPTRASGSPRSFK